jgi:hypothetical protein
MIWNVWTAFEISVVTASEEAKDISLEMVVSPNPVTDFTKLKIENFKLQNLCYQV